ncbi:Fizzy- protein [Brettanomyces bruxellensis]|uniref:Fizzy- protein n=1 Tax=Dekkera bruxellensis TaxID=5007 RepID=A0A8H6B7T3_DEKBR|nr:Fizzy- protein [Brettanomyces bruxellensis]
MDSSDDDFPTTPTHRGVSHNSEPLRNPLFQGSPSKKSRRRKIIYSDRYIPARSGINLQAAFTLGHDPTSSPFRSSTRVGVLDMPDTVDESTVDASTSEFEPGDNDNNSMKAREANRAFDAVLKTELFGSNTTGTGSTQPTPPASTHDSVSLHTSPERAHTNSNNSPGQRTVNSFVPHTPRQNRNIFTYQSASPSHRSASSLAVDNEMYSLSPVGHDSERILLSPQHRPRAISKVPYRVLDAPELADDFYLNLVDWGSQDILGVGLGSCVYLWDASTGSVNRLCDLGPSDSVTSVSWIGAGTHLAVGTNSGLVEIWDASACKCTRTMTGHTARCSSLSWNRHILTSGSRDRNILHRDVREPAHYMKRLEYHKQEVCGLKWNVDEDKLASGGNDNKLFVWDGLESRPLYQFTEHKAAVKAIAWSPHQRGLLASGGGTADRKIKIWNTITGLKIHDVDTGSQVCNLAWSKTSNELVSTHGYSRNQIVIWKYSTMQQIASLTGHTYRVLYLAMSPDGQTIVTGAGDETLRFWNVFEKAKSNNGPSSVLLDAFNQLR